MADLKPDGNIAALMLLSILSSLSAIAIAPKFETQKAWLIPFCSGIAIASAIDGYRRNERNKTVELYLKFLQSSEDNQFADQVTMQELVNERQKEIELTAKLAQLEELKLNVESRLAEFE